MPCFFVRGDFDGDDVAAPLLDQHAVLGELAADALDVRVRLVDLVDRDDDRHLRGARVIDRFLRLRHDAVVGGDDEDDDVRHLGAARAHHREGFVARRVEEHDLPAALLDVIRADVLRDAARFAAGDVGLADRVEQRRLAVVDVTHDGDDRTARRRARRVGLLHRLELDGLFERDDFGVDAEGFRDLEREVGTEGGVDREHEALLQQKVLHQVVRFDAEFVS